jgi:glycosyltransferase involved in cell wall biosynthesis
MNFAFVCSLNPENVLTWSGIPHSIIMALRELGHSVTSVCPQDSSWNLEARIKGRIYRHFFGKVYHAGRSPGVLRGRARAFNKELKRLSDIDYILAIFPVDAAFLKSEKPVAIIHDATWHQLLDFYPGLERNVLAKETITDGYISDQEALRNCKKAVYFSPWACTSAVRDMHCEERKVRAIAPGANLSVRPNKSDILQFLKARSKDRCQLLFIGQDWQRKGAAKAVAIAKCLNESGTPAELYIVGCRAPKSEVLPEFVHVLGFLNKNSPADRKTIERLFETCHFFILPTLADAAGIVFCEAASYGMPCLTHDVGGIAAIIHNEKSGHLFSLNSKPQEWAQWLHTTFANAETYSQFAMQSFEEARTRLNWESFCKELVEFLRS